jgi:hypothetical protein
MLHVVGATDEHVNLGAGDAGGDRILGAIAAGGMS